MATVHSKKTFPSKTVGGKSVGGKSIPNKSPPPQTPIKSVPSSVKSENASQLQKEETITDESSQVFSMLSPCSHLNKVMSSHAKEMVLKTYKAAMNIVVAKIKTDHFHQYNSKYVDRNGKKVNTKLLQKLTSSVLKCKDCKENNCTDHKRVFMCLQCTNIGCFSEKHAYMHAKNTGHVFGMFYKYLS